MEKQQSIQAKNSRMPRLCAPAPASSEKPTPLVVWQVRVRAAACVHRDRIRFRSASQRLLHGANNKGKRGCDVSCLPTGAL